VGTGIALIVSGSGFGLLVAFVAWKRLPAAIATALLAGCGALAGSGALLVQAEASGFEWALTLGTLAILSPLHARLLFGRPGPSR